jgi:hypothetical protein
MTAPEASNTAVAEGATANATLPKSERATVVKGELSDDTNMADVPNSKQQAQEVVIESTTAVEPASEPVEVPILKSATELATEPVAETDSQAASAEQSESQTKKKGGRGKKA